MQAFDGIADLIEDWDYANSSGTKFTVDITQANLDMLQRSGLLISTPFPVPRPTGHPTADKVVTIIVGTIGLIEGLRQWWESRRSTTWRVKCHIHIIGTPNHEVAEFKYWSPTAPDPITARTIALAWNDAYVDAKYKKNGIPAHTQHCLDAVPN